MKADRPMRPGWLMPLFWMITVPATVYVVGQIDLSRIYIQLTGLLICLMALVPSYLWCKGTAGHVPIFPPVALSYIPSYASPLIWPNPKVEAYPVEVSVTAGITIAIMLLVATVAWLYFVKRETRNPQSMWMLRLSEGGGIMTLLLFFASLFEISVYAGWVPFLQGSMFSLARSAAVACGVIGMVGSAYQLGSAKVANRHRVTIISSIVLYSITQMLGLYLSSLLMPTLAGAIAYTTAAKRVPVIWVTIVIGISGFLHYGKPTMRAERWRAESTVSPTDYPQFFSDWVQISANEMLAGNNSIQTEGVADRGGVVHMLMLVQSRTPEPLPYLLGQTYAEIPSLLVPRFINTTKARVTEGQSLLCVYYGLQDYESTFGTSIAFGMPAEVHANFGYPGVLCLGLLLGCSTGFVTHWCQAVPTLSFRTLFGFVLTGVLVNPERSMSVVVTSTCQASVILLVLVPLIMTRVRLSNGSPE